MFKNNSEYKIHTIIRDELGRCIVIDIEFLNRRMTLGNVYGPSCGDHPEFFEEVFNKVTSFDNELIVVGSDWNVALNPTLDTNHPSNIYRNRSRGKIQEFIEQCDVVDIFRCLYPNIRKYTWRRFTQRSRLDKFVVFEQLGCVTESVSITPGYCSDPSLVCLTFKTHTVKGHRPFLKFNNSLLRDIVFVNLVKQVILDLKKAVRCSSL